MNISSRRDTEGCMTSSDFRHTSGDNAKEKVFALEQ